MKKFKKAFLLLCLLAMCLAAGCSKKNEPEQQDAAVDTPAPTQPEAATPAPVADEGPEYTISFVDGEKTIFEAKAKAGETVDLPGDITSDDPRLVFRGWEGVSEADINAGNVEVFNDAIYNAIWYEKFGTEQVFTLSKLGIADSIVVDGELDDAWNNVEPIPVNTVTLGSTDTNGSVRFLWDSRYLYVFAEVNDSTHYGWKEGEWTENNDCFEIWFDLLHNDDSHGLAGHSGGWGGVYRGEPGPMCEAHFKINAGQEFNPEYRFGNGSEACWDGWLSNECNNDGVSYGTTKLTDTGYTVEYRIKIDHSNVPEELRPHVDQEIGIGVKLYDRTSDDDMTIVCMEAVNDGMWEGPKKLSNFRVEGNSADDDAVEVFAVQSRAGYEVAVDNEKDLIYKDASKSSIGGAEVSVLWNGSNVYAFAELGNGTDYVEFTADGQTLRLDASNNEGVLALANALTADSVKVIDVAYNDGTGDRTASGYLKVLGNPSNIARNTYDIHKLAEGASITVDGERDAAYGSDATVVIDTVNTGSPEARGKAWVVWDDEYIYAFVDVTDANVSTEQSGNPWENDGVEFWISTCRSLPTSTTHWGDPNRPEGRTDYCGEGGFRALPNNIGPLSGMHWMFDWADGVPREVDSKLTDTGYTIEYKIHFSAFAGEEDKVGQVIDLMFDINDDVNLDGVRDGVVSTNTMGDAAWDLPYVLDHYRLVD